MSAIRTSAEVGKWNDELFERFRKAKGKKRRELKDQLLRVNQPLVKILTGQVAGIGDEKTQSQRKNASRRRVVGADEAEWDDLLQMGLEGMSHALDKFDPSKGKISGYARWWILTKVQRFVRKEHMIPAPEGRHGERPSVALLADEAELDRLAGAHEEDEERPEDKYTLEDLHGFERAGSWPRGMEEHRARYLELVGPRKAISVPRRAIDVFLEVRCLFKKPAGREPFWPLWNAWKLDCAKERRAVGPRAVFVDALQRRGVTEKTFRPKYKSGRPSYVPERGLAGLVLVTPL